MGIFKIKAPDALKKIKDLEGIIARAKETKNAAIPKRENALAKIEFQLPEGPAELAEANAEIARAEALIKDKQGAINAIREAYEAELAAAAEAKRESEVKRAFEQAPLIVADAKKVKANLSEACTTFKRLVTRVNELKAMDLPTNCNWTDGPLHESRLVGAYKLCLKNFGMDWATSWFGPGPIPDFETTIEHSVEWALQDSRKKTAKK